MSSRKNAQIHYPSLSTIMLQKNPSTNDNYTAPYINYNHANLLKTKSKPILNFILRFMQTITIYFSVLSFKKNSSLHHVSNKRPCQIKQKIY